MRTNPPLPAIAGDVLRLVVRFAGNAGEFQITQDYMANSTETAPTLASNQIPFLAFFKANLEPTLTAVLTAQTHILGYRCIAISRQDVLDLDLLNTPTVPGTVAGDQYPSQTCATLTRKTSQKGQHGQGRVLFPTPPLSFCTPGTDPDSINAASQLLYGTFMTQLTAVPAPAGTQVYKAVISTRPVPPAKVVSLAGLVTSFRVNPLFGTARRRRFGRGI